MINAPSLANCDFMDLPDQVAQFVDAGVRFFHVDVMDQHYVPNLCFPVSFVADLKRRYPQVVVDAHLMVSAPDVYLDRLAEAGADYVSFPSDATSVVRRTLGAIQERGMKAGVMINPSQRVDVIEPYLPYLDFVVLMTVEPGFAGQRFLPGSLERLDALVAMRTAAGSSMLIEIDGGVDHEMGAECVRRGADILVSGVFTVFGQPDGIVSACHRFQAAMDAVER
ncbi:ribulose-phosphate 3-epimerase [Actinotalea sp. K2]|uniref:ribulose-phosphate 3-epimerase n=1 Tax=Actinotalea sp. K2 TaxID=2939438 RepID=UPI00201769C6|nr:ribulose-phosphate 3-epimerase [Actinotalea sp. K2]MCL3861802.1 ribulose-phosphate 3-epimerase [Actinotalea sp. K2]